MSSVSLFPVRHVSSVSLFPVSHVSSLSVLFASQVSFSVLGNLPQVGGFNHSNPDKNKLLFVKTPLLNGYLFQDSPTGFNTPTDSWLRAPLDSGFP